MNYLDWDKLYQIGRMNWESSDLSYAIINLLEGDRAPSPGSLAVLGCGRGHDAVLFSDYGFDVVGFDFAPTAIAAARELATTRQQSVKFFEYDVFQLPKHFKCSFDYILDKAFFCTLPKKLSINATSLF